MTEKIEKIDKKDDVKEVLLKEIKEIKEIKQEKQEKQEKKVEAKVESKAPEPYSPLVFIKLQEFLYSIRGKYQMETLGGFVSWLRKNGMPKALPSNQWKERLQEYINRIV